MFILFIYLVFLSLYTHILKIVLMHWSVPCTGIEFYTGHTDDSEYGGNSKLSGNQVCPFAIGKYGWNSFILLVSPSWGEIYFNFIKLARNVEKDGKNKQIKSMSQ